MKARTKLNHKIWVKGFLCVKVVKVQQPNLTRSEKHETSTRRTPICRIPQCSKQNEAYHKMWVKKFYVRGDDDDDDDEIKTSIDPQKPKTKLNHKIWVKKVYVCSENKCENTPTSHAC